MCILYISARSCKNVSQVYPRCIAIRALTCLHALCMFVWGCMVTTVFDMCHFSGKASEEQSTLRALLYYLHIGGKRILY